MSRLQVTLNVHREVAEAIATDPDALEECVDRVAESMNIRAAERGQRITGRPELVEAAQTALGPVNLTFQADTEADNG